MTTTPAPATPRVTPSPTEGVPGRRLTGVDVARAVALVGMVTVHFGPGRDVGDGAAAFVYHSFYGKASVLFALVAGIGVGLMARRSSTTLVRTRMVYRALWLVPLGLWLQELDHPVAVILQYYGVFFLGVVPFVGRRRATLLVGSVVSLLVGSGIVLWALVERPEWMVRLGGVTPPDPVGDLVLGGYYPALTWVPVLVFGMWLATCDLRAMGTRWAMLAGGVATLAVTRWVGVVLAARLDLDVERGAWGYAASVTGHSEMPLAVIGAAGFATAVVAIALLLADTVPWLVHPLASLGRLALTVYVGHLLVFHWYPDLFPAETVAQGITHVAWFTVVTAGFSTLWLWAFPRGPLEATVRWPWQHGVVPAVRWVAGPGDREAPPLDRT
jgi:uncharacterized membrane protein YeiB